MTKTDAAGRAYATVEETKAGDYVEVDGDFTCIAKGARLPVQKDDNGELYIECSGDGGRHFLDGQVNGGIYLGLYRAAVQS